MPLDEDVSVGEYQRLAHAAIDEILAAGRTPVVVGGTGLYLRAALSSLELPPPPAPGERERWTALYDALGPEQAHALLAERDPAAAARVHANDRRRVVRALELAEAGASLAPPEDRLWSDDMRHPTTLVGLELDRGRARRAASRRASPRRSSAASSPRPRPRGRSRSPTTARKVLGLEEFATLPRRRGRRGGRRREPPARALPAQVASPPAGRGYARRRPPTGGACR